MDPDRQSLPRRLYRKLLRFFPVEFREEFGGEMEDVFRQQVLDAKGREGLRGLLKVWIDTMADLFKIAPREHLSVLRRDAGYALRVMRSNLGFTAIAVITLALGIGANTAVFSVVNAVLLRPLPFPEPDRIYSVHRIGNRIGGIAISMPIYLEWQKKKELFEAIGFVCSWGSSTLTGDGEPMLVPSLAVSSGVFSSLRVQPVLGRSFHEQDGSPGEPTTVILSYSLWQSRFGNDRGILGRTIQVNSKPAIVIGVMPKDFELSFPFSRAAQIWFPVRPPASSQSPSYGMLCIARLGRNVAPAQAEAALTPALGILSNQFPNMIFPNEKAHLVPLRKLINKEAGTAMFLLLAASGLLLLIACVNVANLLLARATSRRREIGIRMAMGAVRSRLVRQLLTESLLLSLAGAAVGVGFCRACYNLFLALLPKELPHIGVIEIDYVVLGFALGVSLLTTVVFGLVPAIMASKSDLQSSLTDGAPRVGTGPKLGRLRAALVVGEVALALVLLVGAGLLIQSLGRLVRVNPGFSSDHLLTFGVSLPNAVYNTQGKALAFLKDFSERLASLPGVRDVGFIDGLPIVSQGDLLFSIEGRTDSETAQGDASIRITSPGYFTAMRIPIEQGRNFASEDGVGTEPVALINRSLARHFWPSGNPIGALVLVGKPMGSSWTEPSPRRIIGIVGDVRNYSLSDEPGEMIYEPAAQQNKSVSAVSFVVHTAQPPLSLDPAIRDLLRKALPQQPISLIQSMDELVSGTLTSERSSAILMGLFGGLGLLIVTVGVYGVISYFVVLNTHDIGVRMALGATPGYILRMVLLRGLGLAGAGIVVGACVSLPLTRLMRNMLFEIQPNDPTTLIGIAAILTGVVAAACWMPARRATKLNPLTALRQE